jgi:xanthine/CO dehydrogenase XdhC/CoxF family maturation factor
VVVGDEAGSSTPEEVAVAAVARLVHKVERAAGSGEQAGGTCEARGWVEERKKE